MCHMKIVTSGLARAEVTWAAPVSWNCIQYFAALMTENWSIFLAVQDSSIGDLVSHSLMSLLILASSEHCRAVVDLFDF